MNNFKTKMFNCGQGCGYFQFGVGLMTSFTIMFAAIAFSTISPLFAIFLWFTSGATAALAAGAVLGKFTRKTQIIFSILAGILGLSAVSLLSYAIYCEKLAAPTLLFVTDFLTGLWLGTGIVGALAIRAKLDQEN